LRPFKNSPDRSGIAALGLSDWRNLAAAIRTDSGPFCDDERRTFRSKNKNYIVWIVCLFE